LRNYAKPLGKNFMKNLINRLPLTQ
jgi:hypothetical protein